MIKLKIKYLLISVVLFISFSVLFTMFLQPMLQAKMISKNIENNNLTDAKQQIIDLIEKERFNTLDLIKKHMIEREQMGERYDVYVGPSMTSWGSVTGDQLFTLEESEPYLLLYIEEAPIDGYLKRTIEILKTFYESKGEYEKARMIIEKGLDRFAVSSMHYHDLQLMKIDLAIKTNDVEDATRFIHQYEANMDQRFPDTFLQLTKLKAELYVRQGELEKGYTLLNEEIANYDDWHEEMIADMKDRNEFQAGMSGSPYFNALVLMREQLERMISDNGELGKVEGRVTRSNGEPISNVGIFLREESHVNQSVSSYERYQTVTNEDGSFSFTGVIPGSYQIHTGFSFEQIDGWSWSVGTDDWLDVTAKETIQYPIIITPLIEQIEPTNYQVIREEEMVFVWNPFPGAASYTLYGGIERDGSSTIFQMISGIRESEITIPVEKLYEITSGVMFTERDWETVIPESVLGFSNPEGTFSWSVKAFNEDGNLIGQSNGYRLREETMGPLPLFHLKARELTEADQVFLEENVVEALEMYKENVRENEEDVHSLRMVARILGLNREKEEQALPYWLLLAQKNPSSSTSFDIARLYFEKENWTEFEKWYKHSVAQSDEVSPYVKSFYARALMKQEKLEEARSMFYEAIEEDRSNRFIGLLLAVELYLMEDWEQVKVLAERYKERGYHAQNWSKQIQELELEVPIDKVSKALQQYFAGDEINEVELASEPSLIRFLKMLDQVK